MVGRLSLGLEQWSQHVGDTWGGQTSGTARESGCNYIIQILGQHSK